MIKLILALALIMGLVGCECEPEFVQGDCSAAMKQNLDYFGEPDHYYYEAPEGEGYQLDEYGWYNDCGNLDFISFMSVEGDNTCRVIEEIDYDC